MASSRPDLVAQLVRSLVIEQPAPGDAALEGLSPIRKAAVLLIGLGSDLAAGVLRHLPDEDIRSVALEIADAEVVNREQRTAVAQEARARLLEEDYVHTGGIAFARTVVQKALGAARARSLFRNLPTEGSSGFYLLRNIEPQHLVPCLALEHPQTVALILTQLEPGQAAAVIEGLPEELRGDVAFRIGCLDSVPPDVLPRLEDQLMEQWQMLLAGQVTRVGGAEALARILAPSTESTSAAILEYLDSTHPELAGQVRRHQHDGTASGEPQDLNKENRHARQ